MTEIESNYVANLQNKLAALDLILIEKNRELFDLRMKLRDQEEAWLTHDCHITRDFD